MKIENKNEEFEIFDLEECCTSENHPPAHARHFRIKIDNQKFDVKVASMTGAEILGLVGKDPKRCQLREKFCGKFVTISPDQVVKFTTPGIERFTTLCSDVTDGGLDV